MRRFALAAVLLAAALTGCRGGEAAERPGVRTVRLFILFLSPSQADFYRWAEQTYEARHPGVDIVVEQFPGASLKDFEIKLRLRFAARREPDLVMANANVLAPLAELGLLDPTPERLVRHVETNSVNELVRTSCYTGGVCYGVPTDAAWQAMYYNKAMFRRAGLDPERPPQTWDELLAMADRLTVRSPSGAPTVAGFSLRKTGFKPGTAEKWFTFLLSAGGAPFSPDGTRATLDTPAAREALAFYRAVLDRRIDALTLEGDQGGFGEGQVAILFREAHMIRWLRETHPEIEFGVAPLPKGPDGKPGVSSGGSYLMAVSDASRYKADAWGFTEFLVSDSAYARYIGIGGVVPVVKSVAALPELRRDPALAVFLDQPAVSIGHFPLVQRASEITGAYLERYLYGLIPADEMLTRANRDANAVLDANRDVAAVDDRRQTTDDGRPTTDDQRPTTAAAQTRREP